MSLSSSPTALDTGAEPVDSRADTMLGHVSGAIPRAYLIALALGSLCLLSYPVFLFEYFDYFHAWVSAHFSVMAGQFLDQGVLALGGVPIQSPGPITDEPDAYVHWPPLYPIVLSQAFAVFGASTKVVHSLSVFIQIGIATLIYLTTRRLFSPLAGIMAALAFVNLPIMARYGHVGLHLHLAMFFAVMSLYCLSRCDVGGRPQAGTAAIHHDAKFAFIGAVGFAAAVWSSWEPLLALPGLALAALVTRNSRLWGISILYGAVGGAAVMMVASLYVSRYPFFLHSIKSRILAYTGIGGIEADGVTRAHDIVLGSAEVEFSILDAVFRFVERMTMLGGVGIAVLLAASIVILPRRHLPAYRGALVIMLPLLSVWLGAAIFMPGHYYLHEYQVVLAAPLVALALGLSVHALSSSPAFLAPPGRRRLAASIIWIAMPAVLLINRAPYDAIQYLRYQPVQRESIRMAEIIERETEANAIVTMVGGDMVPVYYSDRHTIRGIGNEEILLDNIDRIMRLCADCDYYSYVLPRQSDQFPSLAERFPVIYSGEWGLLVKVHSAGQSASTPVDPN